MKKALIIGSEGQDGRLIIEFLQNLGYEISGVDRNKKSFSNIRYICFDLNTYNRIVFSELIKENFTEIYYLAAFHQSSVDTTNENLEYAYSQSINININAFVRVLQIVKDYSPSTKVFYASSSLIFEKCKVKLQNELTIPQPECLYAISKNTAGQIADHYRNKYNLFIVVGILYNHESNLRTVNFLSKKIVTSVKQIKQGVIKKLIVGDLNSQTDWGYAGDYVEAMYQTLQLSNPENFIISTSKTHTVLDWISVAFQLEGLDWNKYVEIDNTIIKRPHKVLIGDNSKIFKLTGWKPTTSFEEMVYLMLKE